MPGILRLRFSSCSIFMNCNSAVEHVLCVSQEYDGEEEEIIRTEQQQNIKLKVTICF